MSDRVQINGFTADILWRLFDLTNTWGIADGVFSTFHTNHVSMPDARLCFLTTTLPPEESSLSAMFISRNVIASDDDSISERELTVTSDERSSDLMIVLFHDIEPHELQAVLDMFNAFERASSIPPEPSFPSHTGPASPMPARV